MEEQNKYRFLEKEHLHQLWSERKEDWENLTGTTTILEVLGKPLTWWSAGLACAKLGWTNEYEKNEQGKRVKVDLERRLAHLKPIREAQAALDDPNYLLLLDEAYKAHSVNLKDTAEEGTDLHAELERFVKNTMLLAGKAIDKTKYDEKIQPFIEWSKENVKRFIGSEVHVYDEIMFTGGIVDCVAELTDESLAIIDFKRAKDVYFSHLCQCGGYDLQLMKNGAHDENGNLLFKLDKPVSNYIVVPFGKPKFGPVINNNIKGLQKAFQSLVNIYREKSLFENQ